MNTFPVQFFLFGCARCARGHISCVHFLFLGTTHPGGGEPRKINIAAKDPSRIVSSTQNNKKVRFETVLQPIEKKIDCGKCESRAQLHTPLAAPVPKTGTMAPNYHADSAPATPEKNLPHPFQKAITSPPATISAPPA
jgi:hypothetical protein